MNLNLGQSSNDSTCQYTAIRSCNLHKNLSQTYLPDSNMIRARMKQRKFLGYYVRIEYFSI
jgi:hypothetical protein